MNTPFDILNNIIKTRRSIRNFSSKNVDIQQVKKIIDVATHAPSNMNRQGWRFFIIQKKEIIETIYHLVKKHLDEIIIEKPFFNEQLKSYEKNFTCFRDAQVIIICCFIKSNKFHYDLFDLDAENAHMPGELISLSLVMQNILLLAETIGLGTLIMTAPLIAVKKIKSFLKIQKRLSIGAIICMGSYLKKPSPPKHLPSDMVVKII